jgi:hypothetical protein
MSCSGHPRILRRQISGYWPTYAAQSALGTCASDLAGSKDHDRRRLLLCKFVVFGVQGWPGLGLGRSSRTGFEPIPLSQGRQLFQERVKSHAPQGFLPKLKLLYCIIHPPIPQVCASYLEAPLLANGNR